jgi:hypothetical protein
MVSNLHCYKIGLTVSVTSSQSTLTTSLSTLTVLSRSSPSSKKPPLAESLPSSSLSKSAPSALSVSIPSVSPDFLHLGSFKVGELPELFILGKVQSFVLLFKVNFHRIFPDGGVSLWANGAVNRHIGARRRGH